MQTIDRTDVGDRIRAVLQTRFGEAATTLDPGTELTDGLPGFDSMAALDFVTAVEDEFGVEVDFVGDDVRFSFSTVDRAVDYVAERLEDGAGR